jgi:hypothetical protein
MRTGVRREGVAADVVRLGAFRSERGGNVPPADQSDDAYAEPAEERSTAGA